MSTSTSVQQLARTAYHEAGHAAVMHEHGHRFKFVTIEQTDDSLGHVLADYLRDFKPDVEVRPQDERRIRDRVVQLLAGASAEAKYAGRRNHVGAGDDYKRAVAFAEYVTLSPEETGAYLDWLWLRADNTVALPHVWAMIQALAGALMDKRTLSYDEAVAVMEQALEVAL